jgi:hypothetical protein
MLDHLSHFVAASGYDFKPLLLRVRQEIRIAHRSIEGATRSAGTSGGAIAFQPTLESEFMNCRMRRPSSLVARSPISGRSGRSAWRLRPVWNGTAIRPSLSHSPRVVFSAVHDATRASASPRSMARSTSAAPR